MPKPDLKEELKNTAELYGKVLSNGAATMFVKDLSKFTHEEISEALTRCRRELKSFPTVQEIIARIPDDHPGIEEAWALTPKSEDETVVWTEEIAQAYGLCRQLVKDDIIAARMAFKEVYGKALAEARQVRRKAKWRVSLGFDKYQREGAVQEAVDRGRLTVKEAQRSLPNMVVKPPVLRQRAIEEKK